MILCFFLVFSVLIWPRAVTKEANRRETGLRFYRFGNQNKNNHVIIRQKEAIYSYLLCATFQVGSGFGQTICLVDVNGDGIDEILVAAPNWFYDDIPKNQVIHDVGTVYVYYGNSDSSRVKKITNILYYIFFLILIVSYFINEFALNIKKYLTSILGRLNEIRGLYILSDFIKNQI